MCQGEYLFSSDTQDRKLLITMHAVLTRSFYVTFRGKVHCG